MKLLVSLAPQALWQAKQGQFGLSHLSYAALNAPDQADAAPEKEPAQARLISDSLSVAQLTALLNQYPNSEFAVAYAAPEQQLGLQLAQGDTPEQAANSWCRQIKAVLQLQQQQRRRLKLFNLSFSANQGAALPAWVQYQADKHQPCPLDSLYTVLGAQLLRQHDNGAALLARLDASSLPLSTGAYQFNLAALQQQAGDTRALDAANAALADANADRASLNSQLTAANDERNVLLQQLQHVQQELEQLFQKKQRVKQQYSQLEQDYRTEVASLSEKLQHGAQTVEKTASQLHGLQDELQRITAAHNQLQQQHTQATVQLAASNDERDLLLQQLQHVQQELEQLFQKKQSVKQQYSQLEQDYRTEVASLSAKLQHGEQTVEKTAGQLHKLQDQVKRITDGHNQSQQQLNSINTERDQLLQQLQQVQQELEQYYIKWQQAEQKLNYSDTARDKQQQRELSKLESQLRKSKARAAGAEHQLQLLQQELGAVKSSTLWKSGAPVRALTRLVKKTDPARQKLQQEAALIITSEYFDIDWYLQRYPDVAEANINPAEHYLKFGANEGRMPGPLFDGDWYLKRYPDVAQSGINPLLHFIKFGQLEGRSASPKLLADNSMRED
ncbi:hypothetical protein [Rheinheimera pleomorphica]|uniref:hypothetical protein n=1 Tax=Rheinheimera pleomorphica TaxID=2703963 RepID=UPI001F509D5D|nr:hypothetical protein [Rheinheimera pleomorphica]